MSTGPSTSVTGTRVEDCLVVTVSRDLGAGTLDEVRRVTLDGVQRDGAGAVILELSGVPYMDSREFEDLRRVLHMAELLGARCMMVGLRPGIIMHLMDRDADVKGLHAMLGLDEALQAMRQVRGTTHG
jgi:rsbT antagonist protein RsbS